MLRRHFCLVTLAVILGNGFAGSTRAEDRTIDGTGNHLTVPTRGAANTPMIRFGYPSQFGGAEGAMLTDAQRPNARAISNALSAQTASRKSARGLSDFAWAWGQFLSHDTDLTTSSNGAVANGTAPIAVNELLDPLGPNPIPFTRLNWTNSGQVRTPVNEVTSYIDASQVYGSSVERAAALRTNGGNGAKLLTSANNLLPYNLAGLPNENSGPVPANQLFLAGDIRANENSLLTSLHTVFTREHNRLVDIIAVKQPTLSDEQQYQLARKIVGAEMQAVTYKEFLPSLLGVSETLPIAEGYIYNSSSIADPSITTAFAHATFRFGHSMVSSNLTLVDSGGGSTGSVPLRNAFFNPGLLTNTPGLVDQLLAGAAAERSEEIDIQLVDDVRTFLFGPPGAGGLDLAALNIQRGRDVGLPNYQMVRGSHEGTPLQSFNDITSDEELANELKTVYGDKLTNIDAWVGALAEDHVPGASVGPFIKAMVESQFRRLRDGDRLFYRGNAAGLYTNGVLNPEIAAIIDLDNLTLADILLANTSIEHLQRNVFFVPMAGDYNGDGTVDSADFVIWRSELGSNNVWADGDGNGSVGPEDYDIWRSAFGNAFELSWSPPTVEPVGRRGAGAFVAVPEPSAAAMGVLFVALVLAGSRAVQKRG